MPWDCHTNEWNDLGPRATSASNYWWLDYDSIPSDINKDLTETRLRQARAQWENNENYCGIPDNTTLDFDYAGRRDVTNSQRRDYLNGVDWGRTEEVWGNSNTVAMTVYWAWPAHSITECDIRFDNDDFLWQNIIDEASMRDGRMDVWNVAAHEVGHCAAFGHIGGTTDYSNIMFQWVYHSGFGWAAATANWALGIGDANGNNAMY
jgi:hypothetical protein